MHGKVGAGRRKREIWRERGGNNKDPEEKRKKERGKIMNARKRWV